MLAPALLSGLDIDESSNRHPVRAGHGPVQRAATRVAQRLFRRADFVRGRGVGDSGGEGVEIHERRRSEARSQKSDVVV